MDDIKDIIGFCVGCAILYLIGSFIGATFGIVGVIIFLLVIFGSK